MQKEQLSLIMESFLALLISLHCFRRPVMKITYMLTVFPLLPKKNTDLFENLLKKMLPG